MTLKLEELTSITCGIANDSPLISVSHNRSWAQSKHGDKIIFNLKKSNTYITGTAASHIFDNKDTEMVVSFCSFGWTVKSKRSGTKQIHTNAWYENITRYSDAVICLYLQRSVLHKQWFCLQDCRSKVGLWRSLIESLLIHLNFCVEGDSENISKKQKPIQTCHSRHKWPGTNYHILGILWKDLSL